MSPPPVPAAGPRRPLLRPAPLPGTGFPPAGTGLTERRGQLERTGPQGRETGVPAAPGGRCSPPLGAAGSAGEGSPGPSEAAGLRGSPAVPGGFPAPSRVCPPSIPIPRPGPASAQSWQLLRREQGSPPPPPPPRTRTNLCRAAGSCLDPRVPATAGGDGSVAAARCPAAAQPGKHIPGQQQMPWAPPEPQGLERGLGRDPGRGGASSRPTALPQPLGTNIYLGQTAVVAMQAMAARTHQASSYLDPGQPSPPEPPSQCPQPGCHSAQPPTRWKPLRVWTEWPGCLGTRWGLQVPHQCWGWSAPPRGSPCTPLGQEEAVEGEGSQPPALPSACRGVTCGSPSRQQGLGLGSLPVRWGGCLGRGHDETRGGQPATASANTAGNRLLTVPRPLVFRCSEIRTAPALCSFWTLRAPGCVWHMLSCQCGCGAAQLP